MDYATVEASLQALLERFVPLSPAQIAHIHATCLAVLLAGSSQLSVMARWLRHATQQDSRVQWLRRVLSSPYLCQELTYQPFLAQALSGYRPACWHIVMDRSCWETEQTDIVLVALNFRHHALPLLWDFIPSGSTQQAFQIGLLERASPLIPKGIPVVFHGDGEFSSVPLMQYLRGQGWEFVLGQSGKKCYRPTPHAAWQPLSSLPVSKSHAVYLEKIELTRRYAYGPLNLFAFYQPGYTQKRRKRDIGYYVTSLPISPHLRPIGRRRWGIECCFQDYKSSGWDVQGSEIRHPKRREGLMTVLSMAYLWATCLGRWLCKTGRRHEVDAHRQRHLSLFRLGWDWLVHRYSTGLSCPALLTLYQ